MIPVSRASTTHHRRHPANGALMSNDSGAGNAGPQAVSPELVGAMVPAQILQEDEIVLVLTKPSLFFLFYSSFRFLVATLLVGVIAGQISWLGTVSLTPPAIALITVLACVGRLVWALLVWTSHIYMLTNRRILTIKGVINVGMFQAQLRKIQNVRLYRPIGQRLFAAGTIGFSTAAAAGAPESTWVMIARPGETHEQIMAAIGKAR
jgi:hypothetical protein